MSESQCVVHLVFWQADSGEDQQEREEKQSRNHSDATGPGNGRVLEVCGRSASQPGGQGQWTARVVLFWLFSARWVKLILCVLFFFFSAVDCKTVEALSWDCPRRRCSCTLERVSAFVHRCWVWTLTLATNHPFFITTAQWKLTSTWFLVLKNKLLWGNETQQYCLTYTTEGSNSVSVLCNELTLSGFFTRNNSYNMPIIS